MGIIMKYTHIIWDFNGTLLNDVKTGIDSVNVMLKKRGLKTIDSLEYYHSVFSFPIIDYYRRLGFDIDGEGYDPLANEWVALYLDTVKKAQLYDGVKELLKRIKMSNIKQILLSATEINMLKGQIRSLGIDEYFDEVIGLSDIYAYSKTAAAIDWIKNNKVEKALMIGDTPHDLETAKAMGVDFAAVLGGHAARSAFDDGVAVYTDLSEIEKLIFE